MLYLRPEDRLMIDVPDDHPGRCEGTVHHVEFLGSNCLAQVQVEALGGQSLQLQFSLNQMDEFSVREGGRLRFALRADRLRVFAAGQE